MEHVAGVRHEVWDVHLEQERWWVVTNPTNLYPQKDFKSRDVVLTFHIGLSLRVLTRDEVPVVPEAQQIFAPTWRRWEQAAEALANAEEAEHFQAVGTHLRECLISLAHQISATGLISNEHRPKVSDVVSWGELFAERIAPGASDSRLRAYLKAIVAPTWNYQQHLLHDKSATRLDAELGLEAVSHLLSVFTAALLRMNRPDSRCENCEANALVAGTCRRCGWEDPNFESAVQPVRSDEEIAKALEEPCIPASDISTLINVDEVG